VERWVWQKEGLRLAKAGVVVEKYFTGGGGEEGKRGAKGNGEFIEM